MAVPVEAKPEFILCAAIYYRDGQHYDHQPRNVESGFVVTGRRHHNCIRTYNILTGLNHRRDKEHGDPISGFITSLDRFVDRAEAAVIALARGQTDLTIMRYPDTLFSEDLY